MKFAMVGTGGVARRHLGVLAQIEGLQPVGHVSGERARAEAQAREWGGRAYDAVEALLDRERPRAVWVCVTPDRHGPLEAALIERGLPFFVEKPLSVNLPTAERIAAAVAARGLVAGVGYKFRALDTLPRVRELLAERPARLVLATWHDALPAPAWWRDAARSGGQVVEQATHLVDLARLLVGEAEVLSALAARWPRPDAREATVPDVTTAVLRFAAGVPGVLSATSLLQGRQAIHLQLICEGRALTISDRALLVETGRETEDVPVRADPFLIEDAAFVRAVREGDPCHLLSSYADALKTHALCVAIREAAASASPRGGR
jgi:predicted dehydrogenase